MRTSLRILGITVATSLAVAAVPLLSTESADAARFTGGNLVVYRVGSGSGALTNAAAPVFLDEFQPNGTQIQSIALPVAAVDGNNAVTATGQSRSEGLLSRSPDGRFVAFTGYAAAPGATGPGGVSLTASSVGRVVGVVDANGTVETSRVLSGAGAPQIIRSAATVDGDRVYATGGNGGIQTTKLGASGASVVASSSTSNFSALSIQGNQLFASGVLADRLTKVGSGVPTSSAALTDLPGLPSYLLSYGYALIDLTAADWAGTGLDTLYLANASEHAGTLEKYRFNGTTWALVGSIDVAGVTGLVANVNGGAVDLAATTPAKLLLVTDPSGSAASFTPGAPATLASAPANTEFRGVALAPTGTPGPSVFVRSPATGSSVVGTGGLPVSVFATSPAGSLTGVTLSVGSTTVNATKGAGNVWTGTVPASALTVGPTTVTVAAAGPGGTTSVNRSVTVTTAGPTAPPGSVTAGNHAWSESTITRTGTWKSYSTKSSPTGKGIVSKKKGDKVSASVFGTGLTLTFDKTKKSGKVAVYVDGKKTVINLYSKKKKATTKTFSFGSLGTHSLSLKVLGKKKKKSLGIAVNLAALKVTP